jgi:hypothetical protein
MTVSIRAVREKGVLEKERIVLTVDSNEDYSGTTFSDSELRCTL